MKLLCGKKDCVYRSRLSATVEHCSYILIEGHKRGCPANENCDKYRRGRRRRTMGALNEPVFKEEIIDFDDDYIKED